jgi:hypothetical protein
MNRPRISLLVLHHCRQISRTYRKTRVHRCSRHPDLARGRTRWQGRRKTRQRATSEVGPPGEIRTPRLACLGGWAKVALLLREARLIENLRAKNAQLRRAIMQAAKKNAALTAVAFEVALKQPGDASLEQVHANLQERAQAMMELRPDLKDDFKGLL